jgi:hypothetical protein
MRAALPFPPRLPGDEPLISDESMEMIRPTTPLARGVDIATTPPRIDFMYYPGQDRDARPDGRWSGWGDACFAHGKYYSAIGDHMGPRGTVLLCEFDPVTQAFRVVVNLTDFLDGSGALTDAMEYRPGKIHGRIDLGNDGWLYYSTYMGTEQGCDDRHGYLGDWIMRTQPQTGQTEIVAAFPIPRHTLPMSVLDADRMVFFGCTAPGADAAEQASLFYAYDLRAHRVLFTAPGGPERYAAFSRSTGRVYWDGRKYDPEANAIVECSTIPYLPYVRAATRETPDGIIYATTGRQRVGVGDMWAFDVKTETFSARGSAFVGVSTYITTLDVDATGRYIYYAPGAHGSAAADGTPVVQFDAWTSQRKVIAFLSPFYSKRCGYVPEGTYGLSLDATGERLFITWNGHREGSDGWDVAALTVLDIPASERR